MKKQRRNMLRKIAVVLLSGVLFAGMEPVETELLVVQAEETIGTENVTGIVDAVSGNETMLKEDNAGNAVISGIGWELDADGTLIISSDEGMKDWKDNGWSLHKEKVRNIIMEDGVTEIEYKAFEGCSNMISVIMPNSIVAMRDSAFSRCSSLETIVFSENLARISGSAFWGCESLKNITIPEGVRRVGMMSFAVCEGLELVILPESLEEIGFNAFVGCRQLYRVIFLSDPPEVGGEIFNTCGFEISGVQGIIVPYDKEEMYKQKWTGDLEAKDLVQYIKAHIHSWERTWTNSPSHHWHECTTECTIINIADKDGYAIHTEDAGTITKQPTETETGIKSYRCSVCGYEMRTETIQSAGTAEGNDSDNRDDNGEGGRENDISVENNMIEDITGNNVTVNYDITDLNKKDVITQPLKDHVPKTGDSTRTELYVTLAMVMGLVYLLLHFTDRRHGMTEETEKEFVLKRQRGIKQKKN